jgi:hypothetical protein
MEAKLLCKVEEITAKGFLNPQPEITMIVWDGLSGFDFVSGSWMGECTPDGFYALVQKSKDDAAIGTCSFSRQNKFYLTTCRWPLPVPAAALIKTKLRKFERFQGSALIVLATQ